jgi:uncharacterized membrane protein YwzB
MIDPVAFAAVRLFLFFPVTYLIYKNLQAVDFARMFKANSGTQIRFLFMVAAMITGWLFTDAFVSLVEAINQLFS